jgi:hypothetical protein
MKTQLRLISFFMILAYFTSYAQNTGKEQNQTVLEAIKYTFGQKMSHQNFTKNSRSALIIEPVRLELFTYEMDPSNQQFQQGINSTWGTRSGKEVIIQDEIDFDGNVIRFQYTFDANAEITGATIFVLLGPLPIPIGNVAIIKDSNGNITRAQVTVSFGGDDILQGDSTRFEYDGDQRITAAHQYFLDSEFGLDWVLASSYTNIEYCIDETVCAYEYMSFGENNELLVHDRNSDLEWYGDYSNVFLKSLQAPTDFYLVNSPGLLLPTDPIDDYLSEPISGRFENMLFGGVQMRSYTYPFGSEELCVTESLIENQMVFFLSAECYLMENGQISRINSYFEENFVQPASTTNLSYNDFGYKQLSETINTFDSSRFVEENIFEVDGGNNLIRLTSDLKFIDAEGNLGFNFGTIGIYTPRNPVTSVKDHNSFASFSVFPNPAAEYLTIEIRSEIESSFSVHLVFRNLLGSICHTTNTSMENGKLMSVVPIGTLTPGVYIIEVISLDGQSLGSSKFIKN